MANFYNPCKADAFNHPEKTTVVGDIDRWAELYLDTGLHIKDWAQKMAFMKAQFDDPLSTPSAMLSSEME